MLIDLRAYENLGTPSYFYELLSTLKQSETNWLEKDLEKLFYNRIIDGRGIFDGCIYIALGIGIIKRDSTDFIIVEPLLNAYLNSEKQLCDKFVEYLLQALKDDLDFLKIFSSKNLSYDVIYHSIQINNSAFTFKFSNFKQLLIDFDVIRIHPTKEIKKYILNPRYKKLFDKCILPEIKKRKIGIEELKKDLEQKQIYGEEAELFVLAYERKRLNNKVGIDWVAEYSVAEGYDILSFNTEKSISNDRCIEVKSYSNNPYFFWTRNEMDVARIKSDEYFLYLINRDELGNENYEPLIIQNPYLIVLNGIEWIKEIEKYRIELSV
jgi:hypothetical protein